MNRLSPAVRRRVIIVVLLLAVAELGAEFGVTRHLTLTGSVAPVICVLSGLVFLWRTRRRS